MNAITFLDIETVPKSRIIRDIGCVRSDGSTFHLNSVPGLIAFIRGSSFVCGHNIFRHDLQYIGAAIRDAGIPTAHIIDTLYFSPLLFPTKPYHALLKDDKLQTDDINNPLNDSLKARDLFHDEIAVFHTLDSALQQIYYLLLKDQKEFRAFFSYLNYSCPEHGVEDLIKLCFHNEICSHAEIPSLVQHKPVELAYSLALIDSFIKHSKVHSITPPWVLKNYPDVEQIMLRLRSKPCVKGCDYCQDALNIHKGLKRFFGFEAFRTYGSESLQEEAVRAAVDNKSLLAVFPTGGGKSITFQLPALMSGENTRGLTVVISPLQSLMKDQVDNLEAAGITDAVTINGLLDPIERAKSFERVEDGSASILYISPEALRSKSTEKLLLGRNIVRFVIDEAHCFSAWGQDFRVDYLYIGDFILNLQEKKNLEDGIPVSCFTATAKRKVIEDIQDYFREKLSLQMGMFVSTATRTNLQYKVYEKEDEAQKYQALRDLIEAKNCPSIVYVTRTRKAYMLAQRLSEDGFSARPYHGKMDVHEKTANQNAFIAGDVQIMVATSAFGMGVDKKDVGMVVHFEISDSLENYVQEAGRAGRDESIVAECYVLYNEEDLSKHFILLNQTKLSIREINQIWKAIKDLTRFRSTVSNSALEIARIAGWDDNVAEIETRVKTAIAALEDTGYLKRGQNMPKIYANSILSKNAQEAIDKIKSSEKFATKQKEQGIRIIKKLFSSKNKKETEDEVAEARVDYISDHLGIVKEEVIQIVNLLREENILADALDLTAFIKKGENINRSLQIVDRFNRMEDFLHPLIEEEEQIFHVKELNESAEQEGVEGVTPAGIKTIINFWAIKNWIKRKNADYSRNHVAVLSLQSSEIRQEKIQKRHELAKFIVELLFKGSQISGQVQASDKDEILVEFSVAELKQAYEASLTLFKIKVEIEDIEDTLFYLSRIGAIKIEGGFLVLYNRLTIERLEQDNKKRFKAEDYQKLNQFYENKVQQIHIVGEYAKMMIQDYRKALQFVEDYFQLNYASFLQKYFKGSRQNEIKRNLTPTKFRQLFGELSPTQLKIITDKETKYIVVAAGPGSGKTRVLVHKLASLLLIEDVKHEQLLMVTFSRAAATEFKKRLLKLIGNAANYVEIKTFHSYCFDLLGKVGNLEKSGDILRLTVEKIKNKEVEPSRITKTVLVIDEAQDMDEDEFNLIKTLMEQNEEMRVIAVGDDDQNIYEFRGSNSKYLEKFIQIKNAAKYELLENYRSRRNLVHFSNQFVEKIQYRLKRNPIIARRSEIGKIIIHKYQGGYLITPLIREIMKAELAGTTCVLTNTNDAAMQITGLLLKHKMPARLIQSHENFNLHNVLEIRFLLNYLDMENDVFLISDDIWNQVKRALKNSFRQSPVLDWCFQIMKDFESANPVRKYKSDLDVFIRESKPEDFISENSETIFVSTIHKAKGKEFDNVFMMLDNFNANTDEGKRLLYVGMTRAKQHLSIHLNTNLLDQIQAENVQRKEVIETFPAPEKLTMHLTYRDVWLSYFINKQMLLNSLQSGDDLSWDGTSCHNSKGQSVLKFSRYFTEQIENMRHRQYEIKSIKVNYIMYWKSEEQPHEIKIILPELVFERKNE